MIIAFFQCTDLNLCNRQCQYQTIVSVAFISSVFTESKLFICGSKALWWQGQYCCGNKTFLQAQCLPDSIFIYITSQEIKSLPQHVLVVWLVLVGWYYSVSPLSNKGPGASFSSRGGFRGEAEGAAAPPFVWVWDFLGQCLRMVHEPLRT